MCRRNIISPNFLWRMSSQFSDLIPERYSWQYLQPLLIHSHTALGFLDDLQRVIFRHADGLQILPQTGPLTRNAALFQESLEVIPGGMRIVAERRFHRVGHMIFRGHSSCREIRTDSGAEPLAVVEAEGADVVSRVRDGIRAGKGDPLPIEGEVQFPLGFADAHGLQPGGRQRDLAGSGSFCRSSACGTDIHFCSALLHNTSPQKYYILFGTNKQGQYAVAISGGRGIFQWGHSEYRMPGLFR